MSAPNPRRRRVLRMRYSDERIWREFYSASIVALGTQRSDFSLAGDAAELADNAYAEYRERFPARNPELDDEAAALETETGLAKSSTQTKKGVQ